MDAQTKRFSLLELDGVPRSDADLYREVTGQDLDAKGSATILQFDGRAPFDRAKAAERARKDVAKLAPLSSVCESLADRVRSENRRVIEAPLSECWLNEEGLFERGSEMEISLLEQAYKGLCQFAPRDVPAGLRGNLNAWLSRKKSNAHLRVLKQENGDHAAFAAVSKRYVAIDADQIADIISRTFPVDCRGVSRYYGDGGRWQIEAHLAKPFMAAEQARESEIHSIVIKVRGADNGTASLSTELAAIRQVCANGMKICDKSLMRRIRHVGDPERVIGALQDALKLSQHAADSFARRWGAACSEPFVCSDTGRELTAVEAIERLTEETIGLPYIRGRRMAERVTKAWEAEPGNSVADVLNAVTRCAHEQAEDWRSPWYQDDLEEQAGQLLYQPVWQLAPMQAQA